MSTEPLFDTRIVDGDILVVLIRGSLDSATTPEFDREIEKHLHEGRTKIIIDCRYLEYLNSMAIGRLIVLQKHVQEQGGDVKLATVLGPVAKVIDQIALGKVLDIYGDLEFARESFYEIRAPRQSLLKRLAWIMVMLLVLWAVAVIVARSVWIPRLDANIKSIEAQLNRLENSPLPGPEDSRGNLSEMLPVSTMRAKLTRDQSCPFAVHELSENSTS